MNNKIDWAQFYSLYNTIKFLYALCEETDSDLCTNLQPLNEFRAALDHLMRIIAIENLEEYKDKNAEIEVEKLYGHFRRAFFDICDMLSINYRTKIIDILEKYDSSEISKALPNYYSEIRPYIERTSYKIAELRTNKRFDKNDDQNSLDILDDYPELIIKLKDYYLTVSDAIPSLEEIRLEDEKIKRYHLISQYIIPVGAIIIGVIIAVIGWFV